MAKFRCSVCKGEAFIDVPYARQSFCREHFPSFFLARVRNTLSDCARLLRDKRILVAVSGGKDSLALLHSLFHLKEEFRFQIQPLFLNLAFGTNDAEAEEICRENAKLLGLDLLAVNGADDIKRRYGIMPLEVVESSPRPCGACGNIRRYYLNKIAYEENYDFIATGHNLDDELAFALKSLFSNDISVLKGMGVLLPPSGKLVGRLKPLYFLTEEETRAYMDSQGFPYDARKCPFSQEAKQASFKELLNQFARRNPSAKIMLMRSFLQLSKFFPQEKIEGTCRICGFPTPGEVCGFCRMMERRGKGLAELREEI